MRQELEIKNVYTKEIDMQVDYDMDGNIYDIRSWSYALEDFIQIDKGWLRLNMNNKYERIQKLVNQEIADLLIDSKDDDWRFDR